MSETAGPWRTEFNCYEDAWTVHGPIHAISTSPFKGAEGRLDSERIAACLNACEGISTENLNTPFGVLARPIVELAAARAECDKLRESLRNVLSYAIPGMNWTDEIGQSILSHARATLEGET